MTTCCQDRTTAESIPRALLGRLAAAVIEGPPASGTSPDVGQRSASRASQRRGQSLRFAAAEQRIHRQRRPKDYAQTKTPTP